MAGIGPQLDLGMRVEGVDRFGTRFQEAGAQRGIGAVADDLPQIALNVLGTISGTDFGRVARVRNPDRACRKRRGAADKRRLLDQQRFGAANGGKQRRR
jgi:hypothetical protein